MSDLWKIREHVERQSHFSEQAERERLVRRFNQDEEQQNMKNLLYGTDRLSVTKDGSQESPDKGASREGRLKKS